MKTEKEKLIRLLNRTFIKGAWHGPAVKEVLHDVTEEVAMKRLPNTHSIIELVSHMTSWRIFTVEKLKGNIEFKVSDEMNFPVETYWQKAYTNLEASQIKLVQAIEAFDEAKLSQLVPHASHEYTYYTLIHGIVHHDLYHTGQIVLIKKAGQ
jgi:hypothetical protein